MSHLKLKLETDKICCRFISNATLLVAVNFYTLSLGWMNSLFTVWFKMGVVKHNLYPKYREKTKKKKVSEHNIVRKEKEHVHDKKGK